MSAVRAFATAAVLLGVIGLPGTAETQGPSRPPAGVPDLSGAWTRSGRSTTPRELPLNARGLALRDAIDEPLAPMYDCVPATTPHIWGDPYNFSIEQRADRVIVRFEKDAVTRIVWLEGQGHRAAVATDYTLQGYSTGRYERGQLVVETTKFTFDPGGLEDKPPMVASSTQKKTVERLTRDGNALTVDVVVDDALMMKGSASFRFQFQPAKEALVEWPECDPEQARAPLKYMPLNQLKYGIR
jgi:hypothetical protein